MNRLFVLISVLLITVAACRKETNAPLPANNPPPDSCDMNSSLLVKVKTWSLTSDTDNREYKYNAAGSLVSVAYPAFTNLELSYPSSGIVHIDQFNQYHLKYATGEMALNSNGRLESTTAIYGLYADSIWTTRYLYDGDDQLIKMVHEKQYHNDPAVYVKDSTLYFWNGGNIMKSEQYRGAALVYTTFYEYDMNHSGYQFFISPTVLAYYISWGGVHVKLTANFFTRAITLNPDNTPDDTLFNDPVFDTKGRLLSNKATYSHELPWGWIREDQWTVLQYKCR